MISKENIIEYGIYTGFVSLWFYLFSQNKYINFAGITSVLLAQYMGKEITVLLQKNNAGGTTPYNPLKIPAKNMTPANKI